MSFDFILKEIKPFLQFRMLRKKDIINIRNFHFLSNSLHPNDYLSVKSWMEEVRYAKLPGQPCLNVEDILLVIANDKQVFTFSRL